MLSPCSCAIRVTQQTGTQQATPTVWVINESFIRFCTSCDCSKLNTSMNTSSAKYKQSDWSLAYVQSPVRSLDLVILTHNHCRPMTSSCYQQSTRMTCCLLHCLPQSVDQCWRHLATEPSATTRCTDELALGIPHLAPVAETCCLATTQTTALMYVHVKSRSCIRQLSQIDLVQFIDKYYSLCESVSEWFRQCHWVLFTSHMTESRNIHLTLTLTLTALWRVKLLTVWHLSELLRQRHRDKLPQVLDQVLTNTTGLRVLQTHTSP